jgi:hypothetical protein
VGGLRSEPVSSEEPPPLLHRAFALLDFLRLVLGAGFWGVGSESRDDDEVSSDMDSAVEEPELAAAVACGCPLETGKKAARIGAGEAWAPLFGDDAG